MIAHCFLLIANGYNKFPKHALYIDSHMQQFYCTWVNIHTFKCYTKIMLNKICDMNNCSIEKTHMRETIKPWWSISNHQTIHCDNDIFSFISSCYWHIWWYIAHCLQWNFPNSQYASTACDFYANINILKSCTSIHHIGMYKDYFNM